MKRTDLVLETAVENAFVKITTSKGYEIAKMGYEDLQKAISDNDNWDYVKELQREVINAMYELLKMKKFISFIHENDYKE